jgi:hypothetical protein
MIDPIKAVQEVAKLASHLPSGVLGHVLDFVRALVDGDQEKAKRAATSAATERIFKAPVKKKPPPLPPRKPGGAA